MSAITPDDKFELLGLWNFYKEHSTSAANICHPPSSAMTPELSSGSVSTFYRSQGEVPGKFLFGMDVVR